jgi:hypothetical protein
MTIFRLFLLAGLFLILFSLSIPAFASNKEFGITQNSVIGSEFVIPGPVDSGLSGDPSEAPVRIRVPPTVTTLISNTSATSAELNGYLDSTGSANRVQVSFQWDTVSHLADGGNYAHETASRSVRRAGSFIANLNSLSPGMDYFYRARASGDGIAYGQEMSFNILQGESPAYTLTVNVTGSGTVTKSLDQPGYNAGSEVALAAVPSPGWMFSGWSGDLTGNTNPATVVMDRNKSITTAFTILNGGGGNSGGSSGGGGVYIEPPPTSGWVTVSLTGLGANPDLITDNSGEAREKSQLKNGDGKVTMDVSKGTILTDSHGAGLKAMSAVRPSAVPDPPAGDVLLVSYVLGPANAKFNPPLNLTLTYDPLSLPAGAMENNLYLAAWDGIEWSELESKVDTTAKTVSASIAHFSQYALLLKAPLSAPAKFVVEELTVVPPEVKSGELVTIKTTVLNNGGKQGEYLVVLKINGIEEARRDFYLDIGKTEMITFQVSKEAPGEYKVDVNEKTARLMILAPIIRNIAPVPVPETISIPATNVITTHEDILIPTVTKELAPIVKTDIKLYIWVLIGIIGVMVLGITFRVIFRKKA